MRWVYAVRGSRVVALVASAGTLGSCIGQLGDLRPGDDAGGAEQGEAPKPMRETRDTGGRVADAGEATSLVIAPRTEASESAHSSESTGFGNASSSGPRSSGSVDDAGSPALVSDAASSPDSESGSSDREELPFNCLEGTAKGAADAAACLPCAAGGHCAGGQSPFIVCGMGAWDHDADAATPCVDRSVCPPGQYVSSEGDANTNRICADCSSGAFTDAPNAAECQAWSECLAPSGFERTPPSAQGDRQCDACSPLTVSLENNAATCMPLVYQMVDGQAVFEAEHPHLVTATETDAWASLDVAEISGGKCLEVGPDDKSDWTTDPFVSAPRVDYLVQFVAAGTYYLHVRGDAGANSEGFSDSCYAAVDGAVTDWFRFSVVGGTWAWVSKSVVLETSGVHVVSLLAREDGFRVDKLVVSTSEVPPTGNGPDESPTGLVVP